MIREITKEYDIDKVYGEKAHDNRVSFNLLDDLNIEPAISIRKMRLLSDPMDVHHEEKSC